MKTRYKRWQVILGFVVFFAICGVAGTMDKDSKQMALDDQVTFRDQYKKLIDSDEREARVYYELRSRR